MTRHSQIINTHKTISSVDDLPGLTIHEKLFKGGYVLFLRICKMKNFNTYNEFTEVIINYLINQHSQSILQTPSRVEIYIFILKNQICKNYTIFKGVDHTTQQEIAIKYSKFDLSNEYKIMKKLSHIPGIPKVYSLGEQCKSQYLSMEYLNSDLHTIRAKMKQFSLKCICSIAIKVLEILKEVHALNIVLSIQFQIFL